MKKVLLTLLCLSLSCSTVCATTYDLIYPYHENTARVVTDLKWGLLDSQEEELLAPVWDYIGILHAGRRLVMKNSLFGFIDAQNKTVITPQYTVAENFAEGLACVRNADVKWGFIDAYGKTVIPFEYDDANSFSDSLALVKKDGLFGYVNLKGAEVIDIQFTVAEPFNILGYAYVETDDWHGYINAEGKQCITLYQAENE